MLDKIKKQLTKQKEWRINKRNKPWSKKQRFIFLSIFGAITIYVIVSAVISGGEYGYSLPSLDLSVNGLDVILICLFGAGFLIFKIRACIKRRKGNGK